MKIKIKKRVVTESQNRLQFKHTYIPSFEKSI